ncbi:hypothetical protein [Nocardia amamiensis]|uniref:hypothetical protein n=1 Tax=Nocardia amamiensis TaxID=404578 RepID=UPI0033C3542A
MIEMHEDAVSGNDTTIAVEIPPGYIPLPLRDINESIAAAELLFANLGPGGVGDVAPAVLQAMRVLLGKLASLNAFYCGLGKHRSADGREVTSTLIITSDQYGDVRNPRLTIADYLMARADSANYMNVETLDISGKPVLLSDRIKRFPAPELPGVEYAEDAQAEVYQIEAVVCSSDGSKIAVVELSTPFVDAGEEFLSVAASVAGSIEFITAPGRAEGPSSLNL